MGFATVVLAVAVLVAPLVARGAPSPLTGDLTIGADDSPLTFGQSTLISGRLKNSTLKAGVLVTLQELPAPYDGGWEDAATTTTNKSGGYRFRGVGPDLTTRYRTTTTVPQAISKEVPVEVRMRVTLRLSDYTPRRRQRVRFFGTTAPEHDGLTVRIQRRSRFTRRWKTVRETVLKDAGDELSRYSKRIRVRRSGTYRARVFHDRDHLDGASRAKRAFVH
jgi:hypothetical protein